VGLLGVPLGLSVGAGVALIAESVVPSTIDVAIGVLASLLLAFGLFALWFRLGRVRVRPASSWAALVPVAIVPVYFLAVWVVCFALAENAPAQAISAFQLPAFPWLALAAVASLFVSPWLVATVLSGVLLVSVAGFALGHRRRASAPHNTGWRSRGDRTGLVGVLVVSLALVGTAAYQIVSYEQFVNTAQVSDEVDLGAYRPFEPGNRLVVPTQPPTLRIAADHPLLDGATALYPIYAAAAQAIYDVAGKSPEDRSSFADETVACSGTGGAYDRLISGDADAIFAAQPSQGQLAKAKAAGVELKQTPIGREAFVFFVNASNPVDGLTLEQIRDIYTKRITNWSQVGGPNEEILAYQRPEDSGSQTAMLAQVMQNTPVAQPIREELADGMGTIINQVATYRNFSSAIGYTFRWYATEMNPNPDIKLLAVDGVQPTVENIRNGSYPLTGDFYAITAGSKNPNTQKLIDWFTSAEGQALIEQVGYVGR